MCLTRLEYGRNKLRDIVTVIEPPRGRGEIDVKPLEWLVEVSNLVYGGNEDSFAEPLAVMSEMLFRGRSW